ncbi:hypothetical protein BN946_scf184921.g36 [Trametes cinnabarina]|uniref:Uncharacterized protein n=1 Tax=Pycnoporus cinnabarinus TaxID=5643 RepID=A0A060SMZ9_PYCCI|nr:hypothetical protein BN946_scf184921.g36 [Trametes cinnabarina]
MKFSAAALSAFLAALAGSTVAQKLEILSPGGPDLWWVAQSDNVISWTCQTSPYTNFTVLIANSNPAILVSPLAIIPQEPNYDCSKLITKDQINQGPGTGYTIQFANPFNETDIYAESQPFEIKNVGAAYPATTATPSGASTPAAGSATGSSSAASGTSSPQSDSSKNGAGSLAASGGLAAAAIAALGLLFA